MSGVRPQEVRLSDSGIITHEDSSAGQILLALHNLQSLSISVFVVWERSNTTPPLPAEEKPLSPLKVTLPGKQQTSR